MNSYKFLITATLILFVCATLQAQNNDAALSEIWHPVPRVVTSGPTLSPAPSDAVVLFAQAKDTINWQAVNAGGFGWSVAGNAFTVMPKAGDISTKKAFGDCQLHIEWRSPEIIKGDGQGRGNSGIFLMGLYELQVLDSYNNPTYSNGQAGSIYKQHMPLVNVCRPPGEWQSYDVLFTSPVFNNDSSLKSPARITVLHNGTLVQNNVSLWGQTTFIGVPKYIKHAAQLPLVLQDHGDKVSFRNIWIRPL